jgi:ATP-dependent Lhr-like helicase
LPSQTERVHALCLRLLERQGVVTREGLAAEDVRGGFAAVYPVLRELEEHGRVRRGYFIEGLGGAQFALPGAVDRLRAEREPVGFGPDASNRSGLGGSFDPEASTLVLAAVDPANPYGAALAWPRRDDADRRPFARVAGAEVALVAGEPVLFLERGGRSLLTFPAAERSGFAEAALAALRRLVAEGRARNLEIARVDGQPAAGSAWERALATAGFRLGYRGWTPAGR